MAATLLSALLPARRRESKNRLAETQQSKLSARFGDVTISAPTAGGWSQYESTRSIESYNTIPDLERLLSGRPQHPALSYGSALPGPLDNRLVPESSSKRLHTAHDATNNGTFAEPRTNSATGFRESCQHSPSAYVRKNTPTFEHSRIIHARNLGDIAISPRFFSPDWEAQQALERQYRQNRTLNSPRSMHSARRENRHSPGVLSKGHHSRSVSAGPVERRPLPIADKRRPSSKRLEFEKQDYYTPKSTGQAAMFDRGSDSDDDTVFDSDEEDLRSIRTRDSGFIFDELDLNLGTPSSSVGEGPETCAWGISRGAFVEDCAADELRSLGVISPSSSLRDVRETQSTTDEAEINMQKDRLELLHAVQLAERRRLQAEKETANVKKLLAAVEEKKENRLRKKRGINIFANKDRDRKDEKSRDGGLTMPVIELVPDAEDIWG